MSDVQIYLTPEGELFDKSVIESAKNEGSSHIQRENKVSDVDSKQGFIKFPIRRISSLWGRVSSGGEN